MGLAAKPTPATQRLKQKRRTRNINRTSSFWFRSGPAKTPMLNLRVIEERLWQGAPLRKHQR